MPFQSSCLGSTACFCPAGRTNVTEVCRCHEGGSVWSTRLFGQMVCVNCYPTCAPGFRVPRQNIALWQDGDDGIYFCCQRCQYCGDEAMLRELYPCSQCTRIMHARHIKKIPPRCTMQTLCAVLFSDEMLQTVNGGVGGWGGRESGHTVEVLPPHRGGATWSPPHCRG